MTNKRISVKGSAEENVRVVEAHARPSDLRRGVDGGDLLGRMAIPILLVAGFVLFSILSPDIFFTWTNVRIMLSAQAVMVLLAVSATIPLRAGGFDLSIASVMVGSACGIGVLHDKGVPVPLACLGVLLGAVIVGLVNSAFIVGLGLDGLIVTLGMLTLLMGLTVAFTGGHLVTTTPELLINIASHEFLSLPAIVWIGWLVAAVVWLVFEHTPLGRYLLFIGGNAHAAELVGLRVHRIQIGTYVASSLIAGLAGLLLAGALGSVDPGTAVSYLLPPFTAAFLGSTTILVGRFNILGTVLGLYMLAVGITGLQLLGVSGWVTDVFNGAALVGAIALAKVFEIRRARRRARR